MTTSSPVFAHLLPPSWATQVTAWLAEDTPSFDWGGFVVGESPRDAHLFAKASGILAGVPFFDEVFHQLQCSVKWNYNEGDWIDTLKSGKVIVATVYGPVRKLLLGERVALNTLARCSGIATASHLFLEKARKSGFKGIVAGTRKTTPGESKKVVTDGEKKITKSDKIDYIHLPRLPTGREVRNVGRRSRHAQV